ncbi:prolipoprotein diacylglyceryl transferase [Fluoribacter gormanii]|uniref:Phosphatidylglycerol--prolipoprotein diacylglyceryl transferase n=1 Tax=Fluoribacter gormanii TaxID=464 RepID=A0A377GEU8_9GAMM|nr:prolipoprotein diacylglyceryl transferase [Fluoribacter gormanii]KTD00596.1 prolipoprotein diacylglyceryl transferase [Fluoribacter gormanii]MCW8445096.1 prolipoprotein diacylglyceryl transferase [Fluoribacter gormanii]MCW8470306.1 prolipoprotein diacylglyceryl transferase [Fluoribacter gormanii]SIR83511.1 Prolipoprotein diacylglyceryl transferase [Fluoribacter gormanii]STO23337.1 Prolipoprotein diacylglyceryl transferase [Fluoribacter gormanii]
MFTFPYINPVAFSLGPLQVHWYGLMYLIGFVSGWLLAHWRAKHYQLDWTSEQISDVIFYAALGVIIGGRVGYMLFYNFAELLHEPLALFKIWQGGMSFHGGLLGVAFALWFFSRKSGKSFLEIGDFIAPLVPIGLGAGRIGNFINGELWGRVTDMPWGMIYSHVDNQPRHPSELYEFSLEGIGLFLLVWIYARKPRPTGRVSAVFLIGYAICRIIAEFFRQPDPQLGYIAFGWLTMGQILSIPMLLLGFWLWWVKR